MWSDPTTLRRSKPPGNGLVQWVADKRGRPIIQDTTGIVGDPGLWYFQDNGKGKHFRRPQPGRGYNFTGLETVTYQETITTIVDQDGNDLSSYLTGQVLTPPAGNIYEIIVNGITYYLEEGAGLASYRSQSGAIATINLNGGNESNFHTTTSDPAVPSKQNEVGYNPGSDVTNPNANVPIDASGDGKTDVLSIPVPEPYFGRCQFPTQIKDQGVGNFDATLTGTVPYNSIYFSSQTFGCNLIFNYSPSGLPIATFIELGNRRFTIRTANEGGTSGGNLIISRESPGNRDIQVNIQKDILYHLYLIYRGTGATFVDYKLTDLTNNQVIKDETLPVVSRTLTDEGVGWFVAQRNVGDQRYRGQFYYFDWFTNDINGQNITQYLEYKWIEREGLSVNNTAISRVISSNIAVNLNGSAAGTQYSTSPYQTPYPLLEGFNLSGGTVIPADPATNYTLDVLGNPLLYKGNGKVILPEPAMAYDRNFADVGELNAVGISRNENKKYSDFDADRTTFNDKYEADRVVSMLVSAGFVEPIDGSTSHFDGLITIDTNIAKTDTDFIQNTGIFKITVISSFTNGASTVDGETLIKTRSIPVPAYGIILYYGNSAAGIEGKLGLSYGINASTNYESSDLSAVVEDGKLHEIVWQSDGVDITLEVDKVNQGTFAGPFGTSPTTSDEQLTIGKGDVANQNHIGDIAMVKMENNLGQEIIFYPFAEEKGLVVFNVAQFAPGPDGTILLNGSAPGTQYTQDGNKDYHHNLLWGYYDNGSSLVPGDPNNFGFAVDGNPIDNMDQVIKYRRIINYLRR